MSIPIHVLSLPTESARRHAVGLEFSRHGLAFEFVDAIDGRGPPDPRLAGHDSSSIHAGRFKRPLSPAELACALGHRAIWQRIAEGQAPVALVCEDDLRLTPACADFLRGVAARGEALAQVMVKLDSPVRAGAAVGTLSGVALVLTRRLPPRTTGYLLGRGAAARLLARTRCVCRPVDMDLKHYWEHGVPVLLAQPQLVFVRPDAGSTLAAGRAARKPTGWWQRLASNLRYQWAMSLGRLRTPLRVERIPELRTMRALLSDTE